MVGLILIQFILWSFKYLVHASASDIVPELGLTKDI